jgi:hypothetical protein
MALVPTRINLVNTLVKVLDEVDNGMLEVPVSMSIGRVSDGWGMPVRVATSLRREGI